MRRRALALCLSRLYRYVCDAATMFAGFVGFTAMVVSLCGPTLSQSSSALPANKADWVATDDVQATPEIPPPPGPFVPPPALSEKLTRSLSSRSFAEPASAVVAPMTKKPMRIPDAKTRRITPAPPVRSARITYARGRERRRDFLTPHARPTHSEAYRLRRGPLRRGLSHRARAQPRAGRSEHRARIRARGTRSSHRSPSDHLRDARSHRFARDGRARRGQSRARCGWIRHRG